MTYDEQNDLSSGAKRKISSHIHTKRKSLTGFRITDSLIDIYRLIVRLTNCFYQTAEVIRMHITDISDAERICLRNLSRIDDKAFALQRQIESLEVKTVVRIEERSDDR